MRLRTHLGVLAVAVLLPVLVFSIIAVLLILRLERQAAEKAEARGGQPARRHVGPGRATRTPDDAGRCHRPRPGDAGRDGYDFIRDVRAGSRAQDTVIPAVAMTAYARQKDRRRSRRLARPLAARGATL